MGGATPEVAEDSVAQHRGPRCICSPPSHRHILSGVENVARGQAVSTTLNNTYGQSLSVLVDGDSAGVGWSSVSLSGDIRIALAVPTVIEKVVVYWSGGFGSTTDSFAVRLSNAGVTSTVYETASAAAVWDRVDALDLVVSGTAGTADAVILECRNRNDAAYAVYEIEAYGRGVAPHFMKVPLYFATHTPPFVGLNTLQTSLSWE